MNRCNFQAGQSSSAAGHWPEMMEKATHWYNVGPKRNRSYVNRSHPCTSKHEKETSGVAGKTIIARLPSMGSQNVRSKNVQHCANPETACRTYKPGLEALNPRRIPHSPCGLL